MVRLGQPEGRSPLLCFRLPPVMFENLKLIAARNGIEVSKMMRHFIERQFLKFIKQHKYKTLKLVDLNQRAGAKPMPREQFEKPGRSL